MSRRILIFFCKVLIRLLRLSGRSGSALPGLIIEKLYPNFLAKTLAPVEKRIVLVTGTNGKTTTTRMLVEGLRGSGAYVITNQTGSNMTRGLIAALIENMNYTGGLKGVDWFVFEMDEAYAPIFTANLSPRMVVALNVLRDQLDRYGEIDKTAQLIQQAASSADLFIYNATDPLLELAAKSLKDQNITVVSFGTKRSLLKKIANEQSIYGVISRSSNPIGAELTAVEERHNLQQLTIKVGGKDIILTIPMLGFHNALNATAATTVLHQLIPETLHTATQSIANMTAPFGRGEEFNLKNKTITVALMKNPSGLMNNLETFVKHSKFEVVVFVVNDRLADGRDVSWLWDVSFKDKISHDTKIITGGTRVYDMSLRLKQDGLKSDPQPNIKKLIGTIMQGHHKSVVIIPTYTALFEIREELSRYGKVPRIW